MPPNLIRDSHWLQTAPDFAAPVLETPRQVEVAILGAGIMGCALAYWLARSGHRPLVVERNVRPGLGATGRNGGLHVAGPANDYAAIVARLGRAAARELFALAFSCWRRTSTKLRRCKPRRGFWPRTACRASGWTGPLPPKPWARRRPIPSSGRCGSPAMRPCTRPPTPWALPRPR
jgi:cation diffusion facilitator CzcD-associated flavoprotein CzcO